MSASRKRTAMALLLAASSAVVTVSGCLLERAGGFDGIAAGGMGGSPAMGGTDSNGMGGNAAPDPACGDGNVDPGESCDDGNLDSGDGCSAKCTYDASAQCPPTSEIILEPGAGITLSGSTFGASDELSGNCSLAQGSHPEVSFRVRPSQAGTLQAFVKGNYAKMLYIRETCTAPDAGCAEASADEIGRVQVPVQANEPHFVIIETAADASAESFELMLVLNVCGDGDRSPYEECDDSNIIANDGCSESCEVECASGFKRPEDYHCYRHFTDNHNWDSALNECHKLGPGWSLAGISSVEELIYIDNVVDPSGHTWIGGNDVITEGIFVWINDEPFSFDGWGGSEPNNSGNEDCVELVETGGNDFFNDEQCSDAQDFLCELTPAGERLQPQPQPVSLPSDAWR